MEQRLFRMLLHRVITLAGAEKPPLSYIDVLVRPLCELSRQMQEFAGEVARDHLEGMNKSLMRKLSEGSTSAVIVISLRVSIYLSASDELWRMRICLHIPVIIPTYCLPTDASLLVALPLLISPSFVLYGAKLGELMPCIHCCVSCDAVCEQQVHVGPDGKLTAVEFYRTERLDGGRFNVDKGTAHLQ